MGYPGQKSTNTLIFLEIFCIPWILPSLPDSSLIFPEISRTSSTFSEIFANWTFRKFLKLLKSFRIFLEFSGIFLNFSYIIQCFMNFSYVTCTFRKYPEIIETCLNFTEIPYTSWTYSEDSEVLEVCWTSKIFPEFLGSPHILSVNDPVLAHLKIDSTFWHLYVIQIGEPNTGSIA